MRRFNLMIALPAAGLLSGLLSIGLMTFRLPSPYLMGGVFGVVVGGFLARAKVLRNEGWAWLVVVATAAHFLAYFSAGFFQMSLPTAHGDEPLLSSQAVGGLVGGFVFIGGFLLIRRQEDFAGGIRKALMGACCGAALAVAGYELGPTLGSALWGMLHAMHVTGFAYGPASGIGFGQANVAYSIYVVWQTGLAFVIALMLRNTMPLPELSRSNPR